MQGPQDTVSLQGQLALLRRHGLLIAAIVGVAVAVSLALSLSAERVYESTAQVAINDVNRDLQVLGTAATPDLQPEKAAAAQANIVTREDAVALVRTRLPFRATTEELQDAATATVQADSNLVEITTTWRTAEGAAALANGFAVASAEIARGEARERYLATARSLRRRARPLDPIKDAAQRAVLLDQASRLQALATLAEPVEIVRRGEVPETPTSPRPVRNAILAALLGLIVGLGVAYLRQALDRRLRDAQEVEAETELPVVGHVRRSALGRGPVEASGRVLEAEDVEFFRILRTNLEHLRPEGAPKVVLVTSPMPEEGKSTVAAGLAYAEALSGRRTLLVDCDLRKPSVATRTGVEPSPGFVDYLAGTAAPPEILRAVELDERVVADAPPLAVIPGGEPGAAAAELLGSPRFAAFLEQVSGVYDRVVLDSPPLLPVSDTLGLLGHADVVLLCVRLGQTTREQSAAARTALARVPRPTGVVMTGVKPGVDSEYVGYYAYAAPSS